MIQVFFSQEIRDKKIIKYLLKDFFLCIGIPFYFNFSKYIKKDNSLVVLCSENKDLKDNNFDLLIPIYHKDIFKSDELKLEKVENIPILIKKNDSLPRRLIDNKLVTFDLVNNLLFCLSIHDNYWDTEYFHSFYKPFLKNPFKNKPIVNILVKYFRNWFLKQFYARGIKPTILPLWPNKKKFAVALTHDVDLISRFSWDNFKSYFYMAISPCTIKNKITPLKRRIKNFIKSIYQFYGLYNKILKKEDPLWIFDKWINIEKEYGFYSTFFFYVGRYRVDCDPPYTLNTILKFNSKTFKVKDFIKLLDTEGWEIGLHGSLQASYDLEKLMKEKEILENIIKKEIFGVRFHCLSYMPKVTTLNLKQAGFKYDTTLGFNEIVGFRNGIAFPFYLPIYNLNFSSVLELPLGIQDGALFDFLNLDKNSALNIILTLLETVEKYNGFISILWHPTLTKVNLCSYWFEIYKELLKILREKDCFVGTCRDIYNWWKDRENRIFLSEYFY